MRKYKAAVGRIYWGDETKELTGDKEVKKYETIDYKISSPRKHRDYCLN